MKKEAFNQEDYMNIKKAFIISFCLIFSSSNALASNNDTVRVPYGAFGILFGSEKPGLNIIDEKITYTGKRIYEIKPPRPMRDMLQNYYVLLTPYSGKVYSIWAQSTFGEKYKSKCEDRKNKLISLLEKEYNQKFKDFKNPNYPNRKTNFKYMSINNTDITISCMDDGAILSLKYINAEFAAYAKSESRY